MTAPMNQDKLNFTTKLRSKFCKYRFFSDGLYRRVFYLEKLDRLKIVAPSTILPWLKAFD